MMQWPTEREREREREKENLLDVATRVSKQSIEVRETSEIQHQLCLLVTACYYVPHSPQSRGLGGWEREGERETKKGLKLQSGI